MQNPIGREAFQFEATTLRLSEYESAGPKRRLERSLGEKGREEGERKTQ